MARGRDGDQDPALPGPIDRWEEILEGIAEDVRHIRSLVTAAWWAGWIVLAVATVLFILIG